VPGGPPAPHGRAYRDFLASRPAEAETAAIEGLLAATRETGCRTHIVHLSAAAALPAIARARQAGLPVTVETCPHYLTLTAAQVPDGATPFKCCPPIRDQANQDRLWDGLADGIIDCVVSDHSPCPAAAKRLDTGEFGAAWGGISSLQLGLPAVWTAAAARGVPLGDVARWMAQAPAALIGRPDRGAIRAGAQADFCVLDPAAEFVVDPARLRHRHQLTPYAGQTLRGVVRQTWLRGEVISPDSVTGRPLARLAPAGPARHPVREGAAGRSEQEGQHG
jgi:allantoinase